MPRMPQSLALRTSRVIQSRAEEERGFVRTITALTAAAGLLITLSACASSAPSGDCTPRHDKGQASTLVVADGSFGSAPDATFPTPLRIGDGGIQVSTLTEGKGETIFPGQYATFQATAYDAATGDLIIQAAYDPSTPLTIRAGDPLPADAPEPTQKLGQIFECQTVGSRVAAVMNASDLYGYGNVDETMDGLTRPDATIVVVVDIQGSILGKAYGAPQVPQQGMPSVVTDPDGVPGVTIVGDAPATLKTAVLQQGDGEVVEAGQTAYLHYLRVNWDSPSTNKSTWNAPGVPQAVVVGPLDPATGAGLNPGMLQAVIGQKVGTQVLVVVPPAYGFPEGSEPDGVAAGDTLVYVIDILGIKSK